MTRWASTLPLAITALWLCALVIVLFPYLDFSQGLTQVHLNFYSVEWDIEYAQQLAMQNPPDINELSRYVQGLVDRIAQNHQGPFQRFTVRVSNMPVINATASPGGHITVNSGLLAFVKSESELAAVLGHEIAHVRARHGTQKRSRDLFIRSAFMFCTALSGGPLMMPVTHLVAHFGELAYSRGEERQADDQGLEYMFRAGIDPLGMVLFWQRTLLRSAQKGGTAFEAPQLFSTHPSDFRRAKRSREKAARLSAGRQWAHDSTAFEDMQKVAWGRIYGGWGVQALQNHRYVEADKNLSKAIASDPRNQWAYYRRAQLYAESNLDDLALQDIRQAIALNSSWLEAHITLDQLLAKRQEWDALIGFWGTYLENIGGAPDGKKKAHYYRGVAYKRKGDHDRARADMKVSCSLGYKPACEEGGRLQPQK